MARSKSYVADQPFELSSDTATAFATVERNAVVEIDKESGGKRNPTSSRTFNYTEWLGRFPDDEWVYAWAHTVRYLLRRGDLSVTTCVSMGQMAMRFFTFLDSYRLTAPPARPADLQPHHVRQLLEWCKGRYAKRLTARSLYKGVSRVLLTMMDLGLVTGHPDDFFPYNAFPRNGGEKPPRIAPLSENEIARVVAALKGELIRLHREASQIPDREAITVYFLVVALRTGANLTPLLEITRQSLKPHIVPGMMRLDLVKYRGANTHTVTLRPTSSARDGSLNVPMDGVAVINKVLAITSGLVDKAEPEDRGLLWLYKGRSGEKEVLPLTGWRLEGGIRRFVEKHDLRGDDGQPLRLSIGRLRKNKAHQLMKLSNGDLAAVAMLLGNTMRVAGENYLSLTPEILSEGAVFVGELFESHLDGSAHALEKTPVGSCKDSLAGAFAPKDGTTHCDQFMHCLSCPSYALVGTVPDLHRLFSFQQYLRAEIEYFPKDESFDRWRDHRLRVIKFIDEFTGKHFKAQLIGDARLLTQREPHKFWAIQIRTLERLEERHG